MNLFFAIPKTRSPLRILSIINDHNSLRYPINARYGKVFRQRLTRISCAPIFFYQIGAFLSDHISGRYSMRSWYGRHYGSVYNSQIFHAVNFQARINDRISIDRTFKLKFLISITYIIT